jgi:hypothetical protein
MQFAMRVVPVRPMAVALWLHTKADPPQAEWEAALAEVERFAQVQALPPERMRVLVVTDGGGPNARQRAQLAANAAMSKAKTAVVTTALSNPIKRGMATAVHWLNPETDFFQPAQLSDALAHVDLAAERNRLWTELLDLQKGLPPVETLRLLADTFHLEQPTSTRHTA